ncbi:addiction module protein [Ornithinimicrobium faecis]|nr:addiction module protein [Ornithinimicrobium sp. HY1745]
MKDSTPTDVEAAWKIELRHRVDDIESGRVELVSHDATVTMAREVATKRP